jgi:hypothetical protein
MTFCAPEIGREPERRAFRSSLPLPERTYLLSHFPALRTGLLSNVPAEPVLHASYP